MTMVATTFHRAPFEPIVDTEEMHGIHSSEQVRHLRDYKRFGLKFNITQGNQVLLCTHQQESHNLAGRINRIVVLQGLVTLVVGGYDGNDYATDLHHIYWQVDGFSRCQPLKSLWAKKHLDPIYVLGASKREVDTPPGTVWFQQGQYEYECETTGATGWWRVPNGRQADGSWPTWNYVTNEERK